MENLSPQSAATQRELERKSNDRIRIYNPTDQDFTIYYGGSGFLVPSKNTDNGRGKGQSVVQRFIAVNYIKHMTDKILSKKTSEAVASENERRINSGMATMTVHTEQPEFELRYNINNPEARKEVIRQLWLGIEEEYGMDQPIIQPLEKRDNRTVDEQLLDELDKPVKPQETKADKAVEEDWTKAVKEDLADIPEVLERKKADVVKGVSK